MPDSVLGIDTSNYTTSAALLCNGEIVNRKKLLPVRQGERGLRQSEAVFSSCPATAGGSDPSSRAGRQDSGYRCFRCAALCGKFLHALFFRWCQLCGDFVCCSWRTNRTLFPSARAYCRCSVLSRKTGTAGTPVSGVSCVRRNNGGVVGLT